MLRESMWDVGKEFAIARVSASPSLVQCRQGPSALSPLLSAGSAAAKNRLKKALFICADCVHCTSQPLVCGTTQIYSSSAKKRPADLPPTTVCATEPGYRSIGCSIPVLSASADPANQTLHRIMFFNQLQLIVNPNKTFKK